MGFPVNNLMITAFLSGLFAVIRLCLWAFVLYTPISNSSIPLWCHLLNLFQFTSSVPFFGCVLFFQAQNGRSEFHLIINCKLFIIPVISSFTKPILFMSYL